MFAVYFAGPDVFLPNYAHIRDKIVALGDRNSLTPLLPGDAVLNSSEEIFRHNLHLIKEAQAVVANLNPFRSPVEPDSGTVYECAYAFALGKPVFGFLTGEGDLKSRLRLAGISIDADGLCTGGGNVEDFEHPVNLMLAHGLTSLSSTLKDAASRAAEYLHSK